MQVQSRKEKAPVAVVITSYNEEGTLARAIDAALAQEAAFPFSVWVIAGGTDGTADVARKYSDLVNVIVEENPRGKPNALNTVIPKVDADVLVLTDGDVFIGPRSLVHVMRELSDPAFGGMSGKLVPTNDPDTMFGFFARLSYREINRHRSREMRDYGDVYFATGYLFGIRKDAFREMPPDILADDGYMSEVIHEKGLKIGYCPGAPVHIRYPETAHDFMLQKRRTRGGYLQLRALFGGRKGHPEKRGFGQEIREYVMHGFSYVRNVRELLYLAAFYFLSFGSWMAAFYDQRILGRAGSRVWKPVGSTKSVKGGRP